MSIVEVSISHKHQVFGYKIFDKEYFDFNYILTILEYSIYKSHYVSEQKTKGIDVCNLFQKRITNKVKCMYKLIFKCVI